jgi:hypothetical protein
MFWQSGPPGTFLHAQLLLEKKSSQFNILEGIPHGSKILISVRFAFHGSVLSFGFDQAKHEKMRSTKATLFSQLFTTNTFTKDHLDIKKTNSANNAHDLLKLCCREDDFRHVFHQPWQREIKRLQRP